MRPASHPLRLRTVCSGALGRSLLVAVGLALHFLTACADSDPLEAIRQQQASGDYQGSLEPLRELLEEHPDDAQMNFLYGRALALSGRHSLATWSLRKAMEDPEFLAPAGRQLALAALATRDFNEVVDATDRILEEYPEDVSAILMRAQAHAHWRKEPEAALSDAQRVLELSPETLDAYEPMILSLLALGRPEEAIEALAELGDKMVLVETPRGVLAWHCATTAVFANDSGDRQLARETWEGCLEEYPANQSVVWPAVSFHDSQGEWQRSAEILRRALEDQPQSRAYRAAIAERLRLAGQVAEAETVLRTATDSADPQVAAGAWRDLGKVRLADGDFGAAADAFGRAVELAEEAGGEAAPQLAFEYADALLLAARLEEAERVARGLSVPAHSHLILGRILQEQRDPAGALIEYDESLRLWPDNPWTRYYAALAAEELGDFKRTMDEYRYAIRIDPAATDARTRAARILAAEGRPTAALRSLQMLPDQLELEGQVLVASLSASIGNMEAVGQALTQLAGQPIFYAQALSEVAQAVDRRAGPVAARRILRNAPGVRFQDPQHALALRALIQLAHQSNAPASARAVLRSALDAHPLEPAFKEIAAYDLELSGAPGSDVQAAYGAALALGSTRALWGAGRLALEESPDEAIALFERAAADDPSDIASRLEAAELLVRAQRRGAAKTHLDGLLLVHPTVARAAALRATIDLDEGVASDATLERARRAVRFGGGVAALELLSQVYAALDDTELAAKAAERAKRLRDAAAEES